MQTPLIAGNWKMNTALAEAAGLARSVREGADGIGGVTKVVCPPFVWLAAVRDVLAGSTVHVGAQNARAEPSGAFTGEVSVSMLRGLAEYVILGHSERRGMFGETDAGVAAKATAAAKWGLRPIVCVGESLVVRERGDAVRTVCGQLAASLAGYSAWDALVVAYEPVWAIGTGRAASPEVAQEMMSGLRRTLAGLGGPAASRAPVLYGGSVDSRNIGAFMEQPDVDGALVGGASLRADEFTRIVQEAARVAAR
ncbi:MAG: triose-phosphate isomerase [Gemmatimonadetes bacterium]|nr:triose-phosphate isomerase [Gemmatimonadota bacterium]